MEKSALPCEAGKEGARHIGEKRAGQVSRNSDPSPPLRGGSPAEAAPTYAVLAIGTSIAACPTRSSGAKSSTSMRPAPPCPRPPRSLHPRLR